MDRQLAHDLNNAITALALMSKNAAPLIEKMTDYFIHHPEIALASPRELEIIRRSMAGLTECTDTLTHLISSMIEKESHHGDV